MGGGVFTMGVLVSGPMQFLQISNLLQDAYTFLYDNVSTVCYVSNLKILGRSTDDLPSYVQNKRLGFIGKRLRNSQVRSLSGKGVNFNYNAAGNATSIKLDAQLTNKIDNMSDSVKALTYIDDVGDIIVDFDKMSYSQAKRFINEIDGVGRFNLPGKIKTRSTLKSANKVSWLHPIKKLKIKATNKALQLFGKYLTKYAVKVLANGGNNLITKSLTNGMEKAARERASRELGEQATEEAIEKFVKEAVEEATEDLAKKGIQEASEEAVEYAVKKGTQELVEEGSKAALSSIGTKLNMVGLIIMLVEIVCLITDLEENMGQVKYQQIVRIAEGEAAAQLATASEIQAGFANYDSIEDENSDPDGELIEPMEQLGLIAKQKLYNDDIKVEEDEFDADNGDTTGTKIVGQTTSSYWDSVPIKSALGEQPSESDIANVNPVLNDVTNDKLSFGGNTIAGEVFSLFVMGLENSFKSTGLSWVISLFTGGRFDLLDASCGLIDRLNEFTGFLLGWIAGPIGDLISQIPGMEVISQMMGAASDWLNRAPLSIDETTIPSDFGNIASYGSKFLINDMMIQSGGRQLTDTEYAELWNDQRRYLAEEYEKKPLQAKLFDPTDYRSTVNIIARAADFDISSQDWKTQMGNVVKFFGSLPKLFGMAIKIIYPVYLMQQNLYRMILVCLNMVFPTKK